MRNYWLCVFIIFSFLTGCKKEEKEEPIPEVHKNTPPSAFEVTVVKVSHDYVRLQWTKATDEDGDEIRYSVSFQGKNIITDTEDSEILIDSLQPLTTYQGFITAFDTTHSTRVAFSFTTVKYITLFQKFYFKHPALNTGGFAIEKTFDGGYVSASYISYGPGYDLWIFKTDSLGNLVWDKIIDISDGTYIGMMKETRDHGFIIADNLRVYKFNSQGELEWYYPDDENDFSENFNSVTETPEGDFLIGGTIVGAWEIITRATLTKLRSSGKFLWQKTYGTLERNEGHSICNSYDGNYMMLGVTGNYPDLSYWVIKLDEEGNVIWEKIYTDEEYGFPEQIKKTMDGNFIICGCSWGEYNINTGRVMKIDPSGNLLWHQKIETDLSIFNIEPTYDGGYVMMVNHGYYTVYSNLVKLDAGGNIEWEKTFKSQCINSNWVGYDVEQTMDHGYIATGMRVNQYQYCDNEEEGIWLLKTDELGNYQY